MASITINPPQLGIHQSEIPEPPPLRIIKRSKTVSGSSASGESLCRRRGGSSSSSLHSKGSPTFPADGSLTVHKLRKGRASILGGKIEKTGDIDFRTSVFDTPKKTSVREDKDVTPKAQPAYRLSSAGVFLKDEYHGGKNTNDQGYYSLRANRHSLKPFERPNNPSLSKNTSPIIPERRFSKSKNFLLRAMGSNPGAHPPLHRSTSTTSRKTLVRRLSRRRDLSAGSYDSSYAGSELSSETTCSFEPSSYEFYDANAHPSQAPCSSSSDSMINETPPQDIFVLYPHIMVTPEISTLDAGLSIFWVAILITGVLQVADGNISGGPGAGTCFPATSHPGPSDLSRYGKLHSMRIDLHPGQGCTVLEIIGNLHESKTIRAGETQLILAKIRVAKVKLPREGSEDSTEGMIADLQNQLGDTISAYLTVRLTYKHSAFPNHKPLDPSDGMKLRVSRIETEATATIKRRNPESAWSPRTSQSIDHPLEAGPVVQLVEKHFSPEKAEEVRRQLIHDRSPISIARKFGYWDAGGSPEIFPIPHHQSLGESKGFRIDSAVDSLRTAKSRKSLRRSVVTHPHLLETESEIFDGSLHSEDMDPARKIWSEMRLTSTGGRQRRNRASVSANHYFSIEDEKRRVFNSTSALAQARGGGEENHPPRNSAYVKGSDKAYPIPIGDANHERERERIMEVALRNKRSVGAETLRSIAPSTISGGGSELRGRGDARGDGRGKNGSATGLGLGVGRAWGWTAPWW